MDWEKLLLNLRILADGGTVDSLPLQEFLLSHGCNYLAGRIPHKREYYAAFCRNILLVKQSHKCIIPVLTELSVCKYAMIKGAVLSQQIYGTPFGRKSSDIDILIHPNDLDLRYTLEKNNFVQGKVIDGELLPCTRGEKIFYNTQSHQTAPFVKKNDNEFIPFVSVDINYSLFWGEKRQCCDMDFVLSQTEPAELLGVSIMKLSPEMEFIALCLHHYKDMNSPLMIAEGKVKLSLFSDIFFYIKNGSLDIFKVYRLAEEMGVIPYIFYCVWYTNILFSSDILVPYLKQFSSDEGYSLLTKYGLTESERKEWTYPFRYRLLSSTFKNVFYSSLDEDTKRQVDINRYYIVNPTKY